MSIIRRITKVLAFLIFLVVLVYVYFRLNTEPRACPRTEHIFLGQKYDVERCSGGGGDHHYNVWLRIYSKDNVLLGQTAFTIDTDAKNNKIIFEDDKIIYENALYTEDEGMPSIETKVLQFPLTKRDWFEANLDRILFSP